MASAAGYAGYDGAAISLAVRGRPVSAPRPPTSSGPRSRPAVSARPPSAAGSPRPDPPRAVLSAGLAARGHLAAAARLHFSDGGLTPPGPPGRPLWQSGDARAEIHVNSSRHAARV